jgi:hypothetical protein
MLFRRAFLFTNIPTIGRPKEKGKLGVMAVWRKRLAES